LPEGGIIHVDGDCQEGRVEITLSNPVPDSSSGQHEGNRIAQENIRQRLQIAYGGHTALSTSLEDGVYPARARLRAMLEEIGGYEVCGEAANGRETLEQCEQYQPDVLLLDIRMPGIDGLEAAQHLLSLQQPPAIIFTTAYNDYALQAFETHAVDYLLKPVRLERLRDALLHVAACNSSRWQRYAIFWRIRNMSLLAQVNHSR